VHLEDALRLIDRALGREPDDSYSLDSRGWVLFRLRRLEEAEKDLRKALAKREDPVILDHLGDVLQARHLPQEALKCWQGALALASADKDLRESLERKVKGGGGK
jgi:tetratricopeptide (TPR) repeat protein